MSEHRPSKEQVSPKWLWDLADALERSEGWEYAAPRVRQAADTIERLTRELGASKIAISAMMPLNIAATLNNVVAERDRLRAALELVESEIHRPISAAHMAQEMWHHAKKALQGDHE